MAIATRITTIIIVTKAAASEYLLISKRPNIFDVARGHFGDTRNTTVLTAVTLLTNEKTIPAKNGCFSKGSVIRLNVVPVPDPWIVEAYSIDLSI